MHHATSSQDHDITVLLTRWKGGDEASLNRVMALTYAKLRVIADGCLTHNPDLSLSGTALVHEAFLVANKRETDWENRDHFFGYTAMVMRHLINDHRKQRDCLKRGGRSKLVEGVCLEDQGIAGNRNQSALVDGLDAFEKIDPGAARILFLHYWVGFNQEQVAELCSLCLTDLKSELRHARTWLRRYLKGDRS